MNASKVEDIQFVEPAKLANVEDIYPMSPMQQGILFHCLYEPGTGLYLLEMNCRIEAVLDVPAFRRAWEEVIRRHAVLRTGFLWDGMPRPMQVVRKQVELPWRQEDWREFSESVRQEKWNGFLLENRRQGFDFKRAPLLRLALIRTGEESYYFSWAGHHILIDGWCWQIVMGEALTLYEIYRQGRTPQLRRPRLYRDYISWLQKQDERKAEEFWREDLAGFATPTTLGIETEAGNSGANESGGSGDAFGVVESRLDPEHSQKLEQLARGQMVTLSTVGAGRVGRGCWAATAERRMLSLGLRCRAAPGAAGVLRKQWDSSSTLCRCGWN